MAQQCGSNHHLWFHEGQGGRARCIARFGLSYAEADRAAKLIPDDLEMTLERAFEVEKRLTELVAEMLGTSACSKWRES